MAGCRRSASLNLIGRIPAESSIEPKGLASASETTRRRCGSFCVFWDQKRRRFSSHCSQWSQKRSARIMICLPTSTVGNLSRQTLAGNSGGYSRVDQSQPADRCRNCEQIHHAPRESTEERAAMRQPWPGTDSRMLRTISAAAISVRTGILCAQAISHRLDIYAH